ncbi:hypothetical protein C0Q70_14215 [Pomacea canaliculata]|uniref:BPTI/Kunitz inhibitor domain-containing protein n=1 Tax=Pomacea canaliculata TaxID=400727 RepID=A0A2T7NZF0_POMCA|nr:hypothetical protein C0Q70_14215 [Pomacea canaliculata]
MGSNQGVSILCLVLLLHCTCFLKGADVNPCSLPKVIGPCRAAIPRFFFNHTDGTCQQFDYGGCNGNANNFPNIDECEKICLTGITPVIPSPSSEVDTCTLPAQSGLCLGASPRSTPPTTGSLVGDVCSLPKAPGVCFAYFPSFFYNSATGECESFVYGGCQGNGNRFDTVAACEQTCKGTKTTPKATSANSPATPRKTNRCLLPAAPGPCKASFPKFYYNAQTGQCTKFTYGGCRGNANRFNSAQACRRACVQE